MQNNKYLAAALAVCLTLSGCANRETQQTASVSSTGGGQVSSSLPSSQSQQTQEPEPEQQTQEPEQQTPSDAAAEAVEQEQTSTQDPDVSAEVDAAEASSLPLNHEGQDIVDKDKLAANAEMLTRQLVGTVVFLDNLSISIALPPTDADLDRFMLAVIWFMDDKDYLYKNCCYVDENGYYRFPEENIQKMVKEVFGIENWRFTQQSGISYDEKNKEYFIMSGFGFGSGLECKNIKSRIDDENKEIVVTYALSTSSQYPNARILASCETYFSIQTNPEGSAYLRCVKMTA